MNTYELITARSNLVMEKQKLNSAQSYALKQMIKGKNVFLTGPAGTGKSVVLKAFVTSIRGMKSIAITSTTGVSALAIGGTTLHSYLGIGLGRDSVDTLYTKIKRHSKNLSKWVKLDVLIIDEVSMLSPILFDKLEELGRRLRMSNKPFGGIQLVLCGDFLQLPVVGEDTFCFESNGWKRCVEEVIHLTEIMRQDDPEFQKVLNELRYGVVSDESKKILNSRLKVELKNELGIVPTRIYTTNSEVDFINEQELDKLATDEKVIFYEYEMEVEVYRYEASKPSIIENFKKACIAPAKIQLCVGAQVMLLCNLDLENGLANGSRGMVTEFIDEVPVVLFLNGEKRVIDRFVWNIEEQEKKIASLIQIPLKLAWACTVHKTQSITLDYAVVNLTNVFEFGQSYVALSRVKNKEGLSIEDIDYLKIRAHPKATQYYRSLKQPDNRLK